MLTPNQLRAARALIGWTQADLAAASGVSEISIKNFERGSTKSPRVDSVVKIQHAFFSAGLMFIREGDACVLGGAGVRLLSLFGNAHTSTRPRH